MTVISVEKRRQAEQERIDASKTIDERRQFGQFATPPELAREIALASVPYLRSSNDIELLEPSAGTGSFLSAFFSTPNLSIRQAMAIELDPAFFSAGQKLWSGFPCTYVNGDFTRLTAEKQFDLVVANPPYVRHHSINPADKKRLQRIVRSETGLAISGLAGMYCHFLLLSLAWMKPGALGAWLIPAEWMSVNYGTALRAFFTEKVQLLRVHRFAASDVRFSDALVSSCVVWFRNAPPGEPAVFTEGENLLKTFQSKAISLDRLRTANKWPPSDSDSSDRSARLRDFFIIRRGIATGDNAFFVLPAENASSLRIPPRYLKPILPSPRHLDADRIASDKEGIPINAQRLFLLDCTSQVESELPEAVKSYLAKGCDTTAQKKLCASRTRWFDQEQREPPPFLCSYMGRGKGSGAPVRFILNESKAIATNSYLLLYPKGKLLRLLNEHPEEKEMVWTLLRSIPADAFRKNGRSYGGGLQKMEPRELGNLPCESLGTWLDQRPSFAYPCEENGQLLFAMEKHNTDGSGMPPKMKTYDVTVALTTTAHVAIRAKSKADALRAVQHDLDDGGEVLCDEIIRIENEIPHSEAKAVSAEAALTPSPDYFVAENGRLVKAPAP